MGNFLFFFLPIFIHLPEHALVSNPSHCRVWEYYFTVCLIRIIGIGAFALCPSFKLISASIFDLISALAQTKGRNISPPAGRQPLSPLRGVEPPGALSFSEPG